MICITRFKNQACFRCPVACSQLCEVKEGPFTGAKTDPEYETIGTLGAICGVSDFAAIIKGNEICDELGIDTIDEQHEKLVDMINKLYDAFMEGKAQEITPRSTILNVTDQGNIHMLNGKDTLDYYGSGATFDNYGSDMDSAFIEKKFSKNVLMQFYNES